MRISDSPSAAMDEFEHVQCPSGSKDMLYYPPNLLAA
jgi:hypothetical protein